MVPRFASPDDSADRVSQLYLLRHWFAHGLLIPKMKDKDVHARTMAQAIDVVKEILRNALADDEFFAASGRGVKEARSYLEAGT